jgi:hypothetical protein
MRRRAVLVGLARSPAAGRRDRRVPRRPPKMQRIGIVSDLSRRLPFWVVFDRRLLELGCAAEYGDKSARDSKPSAKALGLIVALSLLPAPTR